MNTITIKVGNRSRNVICPQSWNDLDLRTLLAFYQTLFANNGDEYTVSMFTMVKLIGMTRMLLGLSDADLAKWEADCLRESPEEGAKIFADELRQVIHAALGGLFDIIEEEGKGTKYRCRLNLTKCPYPSLTHTKKARNGKPGKSTFYYCAADGLSNVTLYELGMLYTLYENYVATNDIQWADQLIATLYRPSKPITRQNTDMGFEGDRRQPLRRYEAKVAERAELVKMVDPLVKRVILFWFASCREDIANQYPKVFKRSASASGKTSEYGWAGVLLRVAGGPAGLDTVADQHHSNALTWLSMERDRIEAEEEARKDAARKRRR